MADTAIERLLKGTRVTAHLATCQNGRPHVAPVWYRYEDGVIEVVTAGQKLRNIRANPYVALSVEQSLEGDPIWTVTVRGTATVVEDPTAFETANRQINRKYRADPEDWTDNTLVRIEIGSASSRTY